jgi:hypothetical protein
VITRHDVLKGLAMDDGTVVIIDRMKRVVDRALRRLEGLGPEADLRRVKACEKEVRCVLQLVDTLERHLALDRKIQAECPRRNNVHKGARDELIRRLDERLVATQRNNENLERAGPLQTEAPSPAVRASSGSDPANAI